MDCPAEEQLIRLALQEEPAVRAVAADLAARELLVDHDGDPAAVLARLEPFGLGTRIAGSVIRSDTDDELAVAATGAQEQRTLRLVLAINGVMFLGEIVGAYLADSSALLADSLDMFADAAVYGIALYGVRRAAADQRRAGRISGVLQLLLALGALTEVARRAVFGSEPEPGAIVIVGVVALIANVTCLYLLSAHRGGGAHMKASWIFTTNDVMANLGVLAGAALVRATGSAVPDLVVGMAIALLVLIGAVRILRL